MSHKENEIRAEELELIKDRLQDREIWINHEINESLVTRVVSQINKWNSEDQAIVSPKTIKVFINSNGGDCIVANSLIDALLNTKANVETYNVGICASAAFLIYLAGKERYSYRNNTFMIHSSYFGIDYCKTHDAAAYSEHVVKMQERENEYIISRTKFTKKEVQEFVNKDLWLFGDEAVEKGIVTKLQ